MLDVPGILASGMAAGIKPVSSWVSRLRMARPIDVGSRDIVGDRIDGHDNLAFR